MTLQTIPAQPPPPDPAADPYKLVSILTSASPEEAKRLQWRSQNEWNHQRPDSVYLAAIGNHWAPGSWQKVVDMFMYTTQHGFNVWFQEMQDRCNDPYDALGTMRNEALIEATNFGFEWLCMVDTDILPEPDTLVRLLQWDMPIVAPFVSEPGSGRPLHGPTRQPGTGLKSVRWAVLSMLLFRTSVFHATGPKFWSDAIGADEGFHFKLLWYYGHRPYLDTNALLPVFKAPIYPLSNNRLSYEERQATWKGKWEKLKLPPDRRAMDGYSKFITNGEYMPFLHPEGGTMFNTPNPNPNGAAPAPGYQVGNGSASQFGYSNLVTSVADPSGDGGTKLAPVSH